MWAAQASKGATTTSSPLSGGGNNMNQFASGGGSSWARAVVSSSSPVSSQNFPTSGPTSWAAKGSNPHTPTTPYQAQKFSSSPPPVPSSTKVSTAALISSRTGAVAVGGKKSAGLLAPSSSLSSTSKVKETAANSFHNPRLGDDEEDGIDSGLTMSMEPAVLKPLYHEEVISELQQYGAISVAPNSPQGPALPSGGNGKNFGPTSIDDSASASNPTSPTDQRSSGVVRGVLKATPASSNNQATNSPPSPREPVMLQPRNVPPVNATFSPSSLTHHNQQPYQPSSSGLGGAPSPHNFGTNQQQQSHVYSTSSLRGHNSSTVQKYTTSPSSNANGMGPSPALSSRYLQPQQYPGYQTNNNNNHAMQLPPSTMDYRLSSEWTTSQSQQRRLDAVTASSNSSSNYVGTPVFQDKNRHALPPPATHTSSPPPTYTPMTMSQQQHNRSGSSPGLNPTFTPYTASGSNHINNRNVSAGSSGSGVRGVSGGSSFPQHTSSSSTTNNNINSTSSNPNNDADDEDDEDEMLDVENILRDLFKHDKDRPESTPPRSALHRPTTPPTASLPPPDSPTIAAATQIKHSTSYFTDSNLDNPVVSTHTTATTIAPSTASAGVIAKGETITPKVSQPAIPAPKSKSLSITKATPTTTTPLVDQKIAGPTPFYKKETHVDVTVAPCATPPPFIDPIASLAPATNRKQLTVTVDMPNVAAKTAAPSTSAWGRPAAVPVSPLVDDDILRPSSAALLSITTSSPTLANTIRSSLPSSNQTPTTLPIAPVTLNLGAANTPTSGTSKTGGAPPLSFAAAIAAGGKPSSLKVVTSSGGAGKSAMSASTPGSPASPSSNSICSCPLCIKGPSTSAKAVMAAAALIDFEGELFTFTVTRKAKDDDYFMKRVDGRRNNNKKESTVEYFCHSHSIAVTVTALRKFFECQVKTANGEAGVLSIGDVFVGTFALDGQGRPRIDRDKVAEVLGVW